MLGPQMQISGLVIAGEGELRTAFKFPNPLYRVQEVVQLPALECSGTGSAEQGQALNLTYLGTRSTFSQQFEIAYKRLYSILDSYSNAHKRF